MSQMRARACGNRGWQFLIMAARLWNNSYFPPCLVALAVFILDQATKALAMAWIPAQQPITVIPGFFDLVNVRNRGAAFGILNRSDIEWQFWLFLGATIVAVWAIFSLLKDSRNRPFLWIGLGLILGGSLGNMLDRLRFRAVIDFLDFYWGQWHWPAFNVADMGICIGAFMACIAVLRISGGKSR